MSDIYATTAIIYGKNQERARLTIGNRLSNRYRVICLADSIEQANKKCEQLGLGKNIFKEDYAKISRSRKETELCEIYDVWIGDQRNDKYIKPTEC